MGTPLNFLVFCWAIGVRLYLIGDSSIRYQLPESVMSAELLDVIRFHKQGLLYLLRAIEDGTMTIQDVYAAYELECKNKLPEHLQERIKNV
jgi:hypothetical protein